MKNKCRVCNNIFINESLIQLPEMPGSVQNIPENKKEAMACSITLDVRHCTFCDLVQITNDPVPYYKDVIRAGSFSPSMMELQRNEFKKFIKRFSLTGKNILEIGSGRGEYLSILNGMSVKAYGMEHNSEYCKISIEKGLETFQAYPMDLEAPLDGILFDAIITINFLEHAPDPVGFLHSSAKFLSEDGIGMIAVPDFEYELKDNYLFSFMSDHLSYFSSDSLYNTLAFNGFEVIDIFNNKKLNVITAYFKKRRQFDLSKATTKFSHFKNKINDYTDKILDSGGRIAVWGASHLAFSVISASKINNKISYIVDSANFKQGKFSQSSGLEIFSPQNLNEDPVDTIIIMCPEYSGEIIAGIKENYSNVIHNIVSFVDGDLSEVKW